MIDFTKKELQKILDNINNQTIRDKIIKKLKLSKIDVIYTRFFYPNRKLSKKFSTPEEAHDFVEKIIGKWSMKTASKWEKYFFYDVEYGNENSYTY